MIDWYVLLVPVALLPIALLFVFVGCGLDEHGGASVRKVMLRYEDIPKKAKPIISFTATFGIVAAANSQQPSPDPSTASVAWTDGTIWPGVLPQFGVVTFSKDGAVDCTCEVTVFIQDTFPMTVGPVTADDRKDALIQFKLTYQDWPTQQGGSPPVDYQLSGFQLAPWNP
jgi:hypothetical protein